MGFSKLKVAEFKAKGNRFLTWRKNLDPQSVKKYFDNPDALLYNNSPFSIQRLFPSANLEHCSCSISDVVYGDYKYGIKFINEKGTFYVFWAAKTKVSLPNNIAVGKVVGEKIYCIHEFFFDGDEKLIEFKIFPEAYVSGENTDAKPTIYNHCVLAQNTAQAFTALSLTDINCLQFAYEGIRAFSNLINDCKMH